MKKAVESEMDYLGDKDFEAIFAITLEAPDRIGVMAASTPTGRRGKFYEICHNKLNQEVTYDFAEGAYDLSEYDRGESKGWQEFHFATSVNPEWSPRMENELRSLYSQVGYEHEVLAEFGTEMIGVFNKDFIDEASSNGYALLSRPVTNSPIAIGVDWDKSGAATQIVVTQWNPDLERRTSQEAYETGRLQVINRIEIPKGEFTYDNAVRKVIEIDNIYNPFAIYVDKGAGDYQSELLRKAIGEKVKAIHFGSAYEVRDPISREIDRKPIKPFMVSQTTMLLERGQLLIPSKDIDEVFVRQMSNYSVQRISHKTGEPVYSDDDDHALDGLMLNVLAFLDHFPDLINTVSKTNPARAFGQTSIRFVDPLGRIYESGGSSVAQEHIEKWDEPTTPPPIRRRPRASRDFSWGGRGSRSMGREPRRRSW